MKPSTAKAPVARLRTEPRFKSGDTVCVASRAAIGHCRTPLYLRGRTGMIVAVHGTFHDPERLAYHRPGLPEQVLYKVRFRQHDLWPRYKGLESDHLEADIYEYWLDEPKEKSR